MNFNKGYLKCFSDKNVLPIIAKQAKVGMPKIIIACVAGMYKDENNNCISKQKAISKLKSIGLCFAKPSVDSCSGQGCKLLNLKDEKDEYSNESVEEILENLGDNFVIQECIKCHKSIFNIYSKSVNTFRIMTYRWKDEIISAPVVMRIGQGGNYLDNAHAGGMFIAIENDGKLHETAFTEFKNEYKIHPDSKLIFKDYKIELFPKVLETAKKMHTVIPQIGVVNWDFTIDEDGNPILIEANVRGGGIWVFEMAWGKGPFEDKTEEILKWINLMKHTKIEDRYKYAWGKMKGE